MKWILTLGLIIAVVFFGQKYMGGSADARLRAAHTATVDHVRYMNEVLASKEAAANYRGVAQGSDQGAPTPPRVPLPTLGTQCDELAKELKAQSGDKAKKQQVACKELKKTIVMVKKLHKSAKDSDLDAYNNYVPAVNKQIDKITKLINEL